MANGYPEGTKVGTWFLVQEGGALFIRRMIELPNGIRRNERFPTKRFAHLRSNPKELRDFVVRLNGKDPVVERIKARLEFNHAYISDELLHDYKQNYLYVHIPTQKDADTMYTYLTNYALNFFINKLRLADPLAWHREQHTWGKYLLNQDTGEALKDELRIFEPGDVRSAKVLRYTINELNRFMKYLHLKRPDEVPQLTFAPISRAAFKQHDAVRKMKKATRKSKYITPADWEKIKNELEEKQASWRFCVYMAYYYGLRRNESLGLVLEDVRKAYLAVERQLNKVDKNGQPTYRPLKSRLPRRVPHLFLTPAEAYSYIKGLQQKYLHPDTLSMKFELLAKRLELPNYTFHDLRRSFITNAVKKGMKPEDLRLAAGHSDIQTTYRYYVMDSRELEDEIWAPEDDEE